MDKKFWMGLALAGLAGVVGVKFIAEPLGRKLQASTNATAAKLGTYIS